MTESEFEDQFDKGNLDCEFAMWISEHYDAWSKAKMLSYWDDPNAYQEFKDTIIKEPSTMLQNCYFEGKNPLESFPSLKWSTLK